MPAESTISELNFKEIFDSLSEPILVIDKDGTIKSFNNKTKESVYINFLREIKYGESIYNYIEEPDKSFFKEAVSKILKGEVVKYYYDYNRPGGRKIYLKIILNPVYKKTSITRICITGINITKQKEQELSVAKIFEEKSNILESIGDAFFVVDSHWIVTYWNVQAESLLGKSREEIVGYNLWEVYKDRINSKTYGKFYDAIKNNRITFFEDYYPLLNRWYEVRAYPSSDGLSVYFIDITERKNAEKLLKESELRYRTLFEQNQTGIYQSTVDGAILNCNQAFAKMLKYNSPKDVMAIKVDELYFSDDERTCFIANIADKRKLDNYEVVLKGKDGTPVNVLENISIQKDTLTGEDVCEGIVIDITEKKLAERRLQESNERYNLVIKATHDMLWDWDLVTGKVFRDTEEWKKIFKTAKEPKFGTEEDFSLKIHPDDHERVNNFLNEIINSSDKEMFEIDFKILRDDGTIGYICDRGYISRNKEGKSVRLIGASQDITQRKLAELQLQESNERYNLISKATHDMVWDWDLVTGEVQRNDVGWRKLFKIPDDKEVGAKENWYLKIHPDDRDKVKLVADDIIHSKTGEVFKVECRILRDDGSIGYIHDRGYIIRNQKGKALRCIGATHDITELKLAELQLKESNEKYDLISKATHDMVWEWDLVTGEVQRNEEGWRKIYKSPEGKEVATKENWLLRIHPDDRDNVEQIIDELIHSKTGEIFELECRILRDDGTIGNIVERGSIIRDQEGKVLRLIGATHDITERKNAGKNALLREQKFRALVQNGFDLIGVIDKDGNYSHSGGSRKKVVGYATEFYANKTPYSFIHPDDRGILKKAISNLPKNQHLQAAPYRYKHANGEWRWMETNLTDLSDNPEVGGIIANSRDITARKSAEDELKKISLFAQETVNPVIIRDKHQTITWVNRAFVTLFGYELDEVIGKDPFDFLPGPETDMSIINYAKEKSILKDQHIFETLYYTKSGNKIYFRIQVQPIFDEHGNFVQSFSIKNDITKQKELEEKINLEKLLRQKQITAAVFTAQENERLEIGRELHDNVNQLLSATRMYIDMARTDEEKRDSLLDSASTFALDALEEIRKLSKTLITPLKEVGLADSITNLTKDVMLVHPVQILFTTTNFKEGNLNDKFKLNVFRIIQEQINNILKHAQSKTVHITIEERDNQLLVSISDDGIGFDTRITSPGIGTINIKSRSELYNGTMVLTSEKGKGTTLFLTFNTADRLLSNSIESIV